MVKKATPFFRDCSSQSCIKAKHQAETHYDKKIQKRPPQPKPKGGVATTILESAEIPIIGERGTYRVKKHGLGIEARRCRQFQYYDKEGRWQNPTCTERRVYNIPQRTIQCYHQVNELLNALATGKKGAPPTTNHKILAMLGCNKSDIGKTTVTQPLSPYLIAAATGLPHNAVRKTMENLVASRKVTASYPTLDVLDEKQNRLAPTYAKAFDQFITAEREERKWIAFRRLFGDAFVPSAAPEMPEPIVHRLYAGGFKMPKKLSQKAIKKARAEAQEWKERTMIVHPSAKKTKRFRIRKAPRRTDIYKREALEKEWAQEAAESAA